LSPDGTIVAFTEISQRVLAFVSVVDGSLICTSRPSNIIPNAGLAFDAAGKRIARCNINIADVFIEDADCGPNLMRLSGHRSAAFNARFSADGTRLVSLSKDRVLKSWDLPN